jgi:hypothetical protein
MFLNTARLFVPSKFGHVEESQCQIMVENLLACSISSEQATGLFLDWVAISKCSVKGVVELAMKRVPLPDKVRGYNDLCSKASLVVIKEIRIVTPGPNILMRESVKILHLVRDARGVVNSRLRIDGFCLHKGAPGFVELNMVSS